MKPRLLRAPLTREDRLIWLRINFPLNRPKRATLLLDLYQDAECRDADLMFERETQIADGPNWAPWIHWCGEYFDFYGDPLP